MRLKSTVAAGVADNTRHWWMLLVSGIAWVLVSMAILQFNLTSVWSIAVLAGVVMFMAAATEFTLATVAPRWRVAHALLGVAFVVGGVTAFVWPGSTFVVLARLVSWYLIFMGTFEIVESLAYRSELWWLRLIAGAACIGIAFWAAESLARSATLLVLWVGIAALMRGITQIFLAFDWRQIHERSKEVSGRSGTDSNVPDQRIDLTQQERLQTR